MKSTNFRSAWPSRTLNHPHIQRLSRISWDQAKHNGHPNPLPPPHSSPLRHPRSPPPNRRLRPRSPHPILHTRPNCRGTEDRIRRRYAAHPRRQLFRSWDPTSRFLFYPQCPICYHTFPTRNYRMWRLVLSHNTIWRRSVRCPWW